MRLYRQTKNKFCVLVLELKHDRMNDATVYLKIGNWLLRGRKLGQMKSFKLSLEKFI